MMTRAIRYAAMAAVLALATACSGNGSGASDASGSGGEVTLWMYPVIRDEAKSQEFWKQAEADFEAEHSDIDLTIELQTFEQRDTQITAALAAGSGPDLVMIIPDQVSTYRAKDGLLPVTEAIADQRDKFYPNTLEAGKHNGELYGVPLFQNANTTSYNTKVLDELGIENPPKTWQDLREIAPELAKEGIAVMDYAGNPEVTLNVTFYPLLWQAGGRIFTEDGKDVAFDSEAGVNALKFLVELNEMGALPPDAATKSNKVEGSPLAEGKVAVRYMTSLTQLEQMRAALGKENVVLGPPLKGEEQVTFANPGMLSLTSLNKEENRQAAYDVISFLTSADMQTKLNKASGTFPTRKDVSAPGEGPDYEAMQKALEYAHPGEAHAQARQIQEVLKPHLQSALQGKTTPEEALSKAAAEAREVLGRS